MIMFPEITWILLLSVLRGVCLGANVTVTLDYGTYIGYEDITTGFNIWKGSVAASHLGYLVSLRANPPLVADAVSAKSNQASAMLPLRRDGNFQSGPLGTPRTSTKQSQILLNVRSL